MTDKKTFGEFIKSKRIEKKLSQEELAEKLFITKGAISKWERGVSYPDIALISDICRILDMSEHEFITASTDTATRKLQNEAHKFRVISGVWFWVPTISYSVALLTCFICNLAVNHTLSWFFIVLASLLCAYTFIPTVTYFFKNNKLLVFSISTYLAICLLLFTCAVYTNGFSWLLTACIGVLMGYVLLFIPILLSKSRLSNYKFLLSFFLILVLTILLLFNVYIWHPFMLTSAILITCYAFTLVILCAFICTFRFDAFLKTGICIWLSAVMFYFTNHIIELLFGPSENNYRIDFSNWEQCTNGNIHIICLSSLLFLSIVFISIGVYRLFKNKNTL